MAGLFPFPRPPRGALYAKRSEKLSNPEFKKLDFNGGDMSTSIIKTALGRTIMVQWDETSPRPYSRHNLIQGTIGTLAGFPNRMAIEGVTKSHHEWAEGQAWEQLAAKYEHPLFKRMGELVKKITTEGPLAQSLNQAFVLVPTDGKDGIIYRIVAFEDNKDAFPMGSTRVLNFSPFPIRLNLAGSVLPTVGASDHAANP